MAYDLDRRRLLAVAAASMLLPGMASVPKTARLKGTVFYRERIALPPSAVVQVQLLDVSLADAPAVVIAQTSIPGGPGTPTPFELEYETAKIEPRHRYALQARITDRAALLFINDQAYPVLTGGEDVTDILVKRVAANDASPAPVSGPQGQWIAESIGGVSVSKDVATTLDLADGKASGQGGCNSYGGSVTIKDDTIVFGHIASTMMACAGPAMDQERRFHAALNRTRRYRIDGGTLTLLDESGATLAVLTPRKS
jgi:putative lipoprotein